MSDTTPDLVTLVDLLNRLSEPADPPTVSMMPQTWGWSVVAGLVAVALLAGSLRLFKRYRANAYRRRALSELKQASRNPAEIALLLRRTALAAFPRQEVAGLVGPDWLAFLSRTGSACAFNDAPGRILLQAPYRTQEPSPELEALAARWIRTHRPVTGS